MAHTPLQDLLFTRLVDEGRADESWALHVLAACDGPDALARLMDASVAPTRPGREAGADASAGVAARAYLRSVQVRGFRGIGPQRSLELSPGPGLTIVCGRNGSGKSSFVEALEVLLTGTSARWRGKQKSWQGGWKNLHEPLPPLITAEFHAEGVGSVTLSRKWLPDSRLEDGQTVVKTSSGTVPLSSHGWDASAIEYRPFLCHSELGSLIEDGNSALHDALLAGLGLDEYAAVRQHLAAAHKERKDLKTLVDDEARGIVASLRTLSRDATARDARIGEALRALDTRTPDLDALERLAVGTHAPDPAIASLESLCRIHVADEAAVGVAVAALRDADERVLHLASRSAGRTHRLAALLQQSLEVTAGEADGVCPVCRTSGVIDDAWRKATGALVTTLREGARESEVADTVRRECEAAVRALCPPMPAVLREAGVTDASLGVDLSALREAWTDLVSGVTQTDTAALAAYVATAVPRLRRALDEAQTSARDELARRQDVWMPVATILAAWMSKARLARQAATLITNLKAAEKWVTTTIDATRNERLEPVVQQAMQYWSEVRLNSSVNLRDITLAGAANRRTVKVDVSVDGDEAPALGVMSQGELNCLALSLFLPRAALPGSPFGFVVVDDPVQAMDPAKVEGLARVFAQAAATHQVIVLTHDDRLPEAVRRLGLQAHFLDVSRRDGSVVDVRRGDGPVETCLSDAIAVAKTPEMPDELKQKLVPGFCRSALEAACIEAVRRRWLARGDRHVDVDARLTDAPTLRHMVALVLFDAAGDERRVETSLRNSKVPDAVGTFQACRGGAHGAFTGDAEALIAHTRKLAIYLRERVRGAA